MVALKYLPALMSIHLFQQNYNPSHTTWKSKNIFPRILLNTRLGLSEFL
jgi:hypothetical protein